jgi:hypothetical protein
MDQIARNTPGERFPALQMSPQAIDAELRRLPPQLLTMLRGELGLDRDGSPLGLADKARLMYAARHRMSMHDVARGRRPNAVPGSSGPQQQPPPGHPQLMQQQPPPGQQGPPPMQPPPQRPTRDSTSPPEDVRDDGIHSLHAVADPVVSRRTGCLSSRRRQSG